MKLVYNAGGQGREVLRYLREAAPDEEVILVDDHDHIQAVDYTEALRLKVAHGCPIFVGFGDPALRRAKTAQVEADGFALHSIRAASAVIGERVSLGPMSMLMDYAVLTADIRIGKGFHANLHASVSHDCVIGDYVTLAPKATVLGRVEIGDNVYIGAGAVILQGKPGKPMRIGAGAMIGAGAVVTGGVMPGETVVGVPARPLDKPC